MADVVRLAFQNLLLLLIVTKLRDHHLPLLNYLSKNYNLRHCFAFSGVINTIRVGFLPYHLIEWILQSKGSLVMRSPKARQAPTHKWRWDT